MKATYYKIRIVNGEFWQTEYENVTQDEEFDTLEDVRLAVKEFLSETQHAKMNYAQDDIEVVEYVQVERTVPVDEVWK